MGTEARAPWISVTRPSLTWKCLFWGQGGAQGPEEGVTASDPALGVSVSVTHTNESTHLCMS